MAAVVVVVVAGGAIAVMRATEQAGVARLVLTHVACVALTEQAELVQLRRLNTCIVLAVGSHWASAALRTAHNSYRTELVKATTRQYVAYVALVALVVAALGDADAAGGGGGRRPCCEVG